MKAAEGHLEQIPQGGSCAADQHDLIADGISGNGVLEPLRQGVAAIAARLAVEEHPLQPEAGFDFVVITTGIRCQPGVVIGAGVDGPTDGAVPGGDLHHPHRERHGGFVLAGDMDEIAAQNPIGIEAEVVVRLPLGRCTRNCGDAGRHIEDRHQRGFLAETIPQALLLGADALIAVEIEADGAGATAAQAIDAAAEQAIVDRPAVALDVAFLNADQGDRTVQAGRGLPATGDQVVEGQIHRLGQAALTQQGEHRQGDEVGPDSKQQLGRTLHSCR